MEERLQKLLSQWGVASRRRAESLILAGRVTVNGLPAHLGQRANPDTDRIEVDGTQLNAVNQPQKQYLLLHKPRGVVSTCSDPQGRRTVIDLIPDHLRLGAGIHPVGRLDTDSTGALLLTNDGQLTHRLTHPRHHIPKIYRVKVQGVPNQRDLDRWRRGVVLDGQSTRPAQVRLLRAWGKETALLEVVLQEGRYRQIRRVAEALGYPVISLHRCAIGPIDVAQLKRGNCRQLTTTEVSQLKALFEEPISKGEQPR
ncbi:MAG: pseudouridine synthase [Cyanobacteria bacterium J06648_16]